MHRKRNNSKGVKITGKRFGYMPCIWDQIDLALCNHGWSNLNWFIEFWKSMLPYLSFQSLESKRLFLYEFNAPNCNLSSQNSVLNTLMITFYCENIESIKFFDQADWLTNHLISLKSLNKSFCLSIRLDWVELKLWILMIGTRFVCKINQ